MKWYKGVCLAKENLKNQNILAYLHVFAKKVACVYDVFYFSM